MSNQDNTFDRDEMDAISADLLLKKLRDGLDKQQGTQESPEKSERKQAAHISEEAVELAKSEILQVEPEEFGGDDFSEEKLRNIMNMPLPEEPVVDEVSDDDAETVEEMPGETVGAEDTTDAEDLPWYDDDDVVTEEDEADSAAVEEDETVADTTIEIDDEELIKAVIAGNKQENAGAEDVGFLAGVAKMLEEDKNNKSVFDDDYDSDDLSDNEDTAYDEAFDVSDGREYSGLNGNEMNSTEMSLANLFLGEEKIEEVYGKERAEEIIKSGEELELKQIPKKKKFYELFDSDYEYTDNSQNKEIRERYSKRFAGATTRFVLAVVFAAILFFFENAGVFGIRMPSTLNSTVYPVVCAMINLQLVFLCALMITDKLAIGFMSLFKLKPTYESIPAILLIMSVIYTAVMAFVPGVKVATFYNFPVALTFVFTLFYEILNLKREVMSFDVVSAVKRKYTIRKLTEEERAEEAKLFTDYVPEDSAMFAVTRCNFADGFFNRINYTRKATNIPVVVILTLAEMLISAGVAVFLKTDIHIAATMVFLTGVLGLPCTLMISGSYSFYRAVKNSYKGDSTIVGDKSIDEYCDGSVVFFEDRDIFPSTGVKINSVKVYGENRIDGVIYYAASIFSKIGGPLSDVFGLATVEIGHSESVEVAEREDDGMKCIVDGTEIYLGTNDYMKSKDFETPYGESDELLERRDGIKLMFIANEEEILAKFYVQYTVDSEYEDIFRQLYKAGMCIGVRTCDPNIDDEFVSRKFALQDDYPIKVVHAKLGRDFVRKLDRADSGIVSAGSVKSLLRSLAMCDRIKYISKLHTIFEVIGALLSLVVVVGLVLLNRIELGSVYAALYGAFWLIPTMIVTMFTE